MREDIMFANAFRKRKKQYYKPNITNLRGPIGRSIIETIMNTPKPDDALLKKRAEECERNMLAMMR